MNIYFTGIKGIAMAALAIVAKERGDTVCGSDIADEFPSESELLGRNIRIDVGFLPEYIDAFKPDLVVYTGAHGGSNNPQVVYAKKHGIPVLPHGRALGEFMRGKRQASAAGCHGKTTTASMIAFIASKSGMDPSYAVGTGNIPGLGAAGHWGKGEWFIAEADEYLTDPSSDRTPRFLWQSPEILVITNIEYDHPDAYKDMDEIRSAYGKLTDKVTGRIIANGDDPESKNIKAKAEILRVGFSAGNDYRIGNISSKNQSVSFVLDGTKIFLKVPGRHNVMNAAMAAVACKTMGIPWGKIAKNIKEFTGSRRRFELIKETGGIRFYDDYAHHPTEIRATLSAARLWFPKNRIIAVFQPHTYSRTKAMLAEFADSFSDADIAVITDIYASAREDPDPDFSGKNLAEIIDSAVYAAKPKDVKESLTENIRENDVVIFMGAGDIYNWGREIAGSFKFQMTNFK